MQDWCCQHQSETKLHLFILNLKTVKDQFLVLHQMQVWQWHQWWEISITASNFLVVSIHVAEMSMLSFDWCCHDQFSYQTWNCLRVLLFGVLVPYRCFRTWKRNKSRTNSYLATSSISNISQSKKMARWQIFCRSFLLLLPSSLVSS